MDGSAAPEGFAALPRPETRFNRLLLWLSGHWPRRTLALDDLRPSLEATLETFGDLGVDDDALEIVRRSFEHHWHAVDTPAPRNVWFGEVVFGADEVPLVFIYTDSPWSRTPQQLFRLATLASVDHIVAHLVEYHLGADYGEAAACRDQFRLMLARRGWQYKISAMAVVALHRVHKQIPLRGYLPALKERLESSGR